MSARQAAVGLSLLLAFAVPAAAQPVFVRDAGPGRLGRLVRGALARPHDVIARDSADLVFGRDTTLERSLVVIGRDVRVSSAIEGDLIVLGGDVYLRPGARIDGDVLAAGGAVYDSYLARVGGERHSFRDETLVATRLPDGRIALDYRPLRTREFAAFSLPGIYGLRLPTYDRANGATLPVAPLLLLDSGRVTLEPTLTYRSHLGKVDPSVAGELSLGRRTRVEAFAGRTSRTNDDWINGDFSNSLGAFWSGRDTRNWYRADLGRLAIHRAYEGPTWDITPFAGAQWERGWTTGIQDPPRHLAWSVTERTDTVEGMARPNPAIAPGTIASAIAGFDASWEAAPQDLELRATGMVEGAPRSVGAGRFAQLTLDGRVTFPLTRTLNFRFEWHGVGTVGDAPPQRWAYLGGSGTLKTLDLLSLGGDQLVYFESRAWMPLEIVQLPLVGAPTLMLRHMMGSAGEGGLPGLTHNLAVRLSMLLVRGELTIDPVSGARDISVGVSFTR